MQLTATITDRHGETGTIAAEGSITDLRAAFDELLKDAPCECDQPQFFEDGFWWCSGCYRECGEARR